jgi:hypothetical protein
LKNLKRRDYSKDTEVDGRIILKMILVWDWIRLAEDRRLVAGSYENVDELPISINVEISWLPEQSPFQGGLTFVKLHVTLRDIL